MLLQMQDITTWVTAILLLANVQETFASPTTMGSAHQLRRRTQRSLPNKRDAPRLQLRHNTQQHAKKALSPEWLIREREKLDARYGGTSSFTKRGEVTLANQDYDASYSASVSIGTPAQAFDIALDTGSADLWVTSTTCASSTCNTLPTKFDATKSNTFKNSSTPFTITYGSGNAQGYLATDTVSLADYTVPSQTFAVIQAMSASLINEPLSGLMGLGFSSLAVSRSTPWWVGLATSQWNEPVFAFYLKRYRNVASASSTEADGGSVSFGQLDSSLYTGDITYIPVADGKQAYWNIPIAGVTSQGKRVNLGSSVNAAIDTGTTLIGGPAATVAAIYAAIPGSKAMTGSYAGYYEYPCSTDISMTMTFDSFTVEINQADFNIGSYGVDGTMCIGGVYVQSLSSSSSIQWIIGDTMLKNVYSVYRYSPAAVGFAKLASDTSSTGNTPSSSTSASPAAASSTGASTSLGSTVSSASSNASMTSTASSSSSGTATATSALSSTSASASSTDSDGGVVATVVTTVRAASIPPAAQTSMISGATGTAAESTPSSTSAGFKTISYSARDVMIVLTLVATGMALL